MRIKRWVSKLWSIKRKLASFLVLGRASMAPLTMSAPVLGGYLATAEIPGKEILLLSALGLCAHFFGFALNDIFDHQVDRFSPYRRYGPLHTGQLSFFEAWTFTLIQPVFAVLISFYLLGNSLWGFLLLTSSIGLSITYNIWSKTGKLDRLLAELSLAASVSLLFLFGFYTQNNLFTLEPLMYAVLLAMMLLLLNSVPSGLKDLKTDQLANSQSFVLSRGCKTQNSDQVFISPWVKRYSYILQSIILVLVAVLGLHSKNTFIVLQLVLCVYGLLHLRLLLNVTSFSTLRKSTPLLGGYYNYFAFVLFFMQYFHPITISMISFFIFLSLAFPILLIFQIGKRGFVLLNG
jgi:4-hydroxybenzoate polyprenyltransferase